MRAALFLVAAAVGAGASVSDVTPASANCSVFDRHPCAPTVCSVFRRRPCIPEILPPISEDLRLTIESAATVAAGPDDPTTAQAHHGEADPSEHKIDTIQELFDALRSCWIPPSMEDARPGMQMSVRLSFKRTGEIIGTPRVTYSSPEASRENRDIYQRAITAALDRCTPIPFSRGMGGAVAGRPIAIRFVDNRSKP